jgi:hypothetical protein
MPKASIVLASKGLKQNSINLYLSQLRTLNGGVEPTTYKTFEDTAAVDRKIEPYATNSKRTFYIALVAFLPETNKARKYYYSKMMEINKGSFENTEKSQKQKDVWITQEEVMEVWRKLGKEVDNIYESPHKLMPYDFGQIRKYVLLSLFVLNPPRRALDYTDMIIIPQYEEGMDKKYNYMSLDDKTFYFNNYKTAGAYHTQSVPINPELFDIITSYKIDGFLLGDGKPLPTQNVTKMFWSIFKKKISVSMLRNIFLTSKYGGKLEELKNDVKNMATSMNMATNHYIKKV